MTSECSACHAALVFRVDSEFRWQIERGPAAPLLFEPAIDWTRFRAPTIINDY